MHRIRTPGPRNGASWTLPWWTRCLARMSITDSHLGMSVESQESSTPSPDRAFPNYKSPCKPANERPISCPLPAHIVSATTLTHMQDPKKEIANIVRTLCTTRDANELEETITSYFLPDAKFSHPLCKANSRNEILGLFQWYRLASPETQIQIPSVSEYSSSES